MFGSKYYPGEYRGVYGRLMINITTGEIEDELDREAINNAARLNAYETEEDKDGYKRLTYAYIQDEVFGIDEDYSVGRGLSETKTGVKVDINHWTGPNIDATIIIDDEGTRLAGEPQPFKRY